MSKWGRNTAMALTVGLFILGGAHRARAEAPQAAPAPAKAAGAPDSGKATKKDEKKAVSLADDVVKKIVETDLTKKREDLNTAIQFLLYATDPNAEKNPKEKVFKFNETQVKDIANKLAATFMQPSTSIEITMALSRVMPTLEQIIPEKIPLLKQRTCRYEIRAKWPFRIDL